MHSQMSEAATWQALIGQPPPRGRRGIHATCVSYVPVDLAEERRGHIPGVGWVLPGQGTVIPPPSHSTHSADITRLKKREKLLTKQVNMFMRLFRSGDKFSQMLMQLESQPEYGGGSGSGGCGDDEPGDDEDGGEGEEGEDDS
nr:hypothetical protein [Tanacetum cinerariifolium]